MRCCRGRVWILQYVLYNRVAGTVLTQCADIGIIPRQGRISEMIGDLPASEEATKATKLPAKIVSEILLRTEART